MYFESIAADNEVEELLAAAGLPVSDLSSNRAFHLFGLRESGDLVGTVGIEGYGENGLLRSLVVVAAKRNSGAGARLVHHAEKWAAENGIRSLYLLTTTAAGFFSKLGYEEIGRSEAPEAIRITEQFSDLCPSSSAFMRKVLAASEMLQS